MNSLYRYPLCFLKGACQVRHENIKDQIFIDAGNLDGSAIYRLAAFTRYPLADQWLDENGLENGESELHLPKCNRYIPMYDITAFTFLTLIVVASTTWKSGRPYNTRAPVKIIEIDTILGISP